MESKVGAWQGIAGVVGLARKDVIARRHKAGGVWVARQGPQGHGRAGQAGCVVSWIVPEG